MQKANVILDRHYLYPGKVFSSRKPYIIDTILGSCVAVFLWDSVLQFGSVNHFMLPFGSKENISFKYGDIATTEIISRMIILGTDKKNIKAKIFGGSDITHTNGVFSIGKRNVALARDILKAEGIPIISYSIGGSLGRKVIFNTASGVVLISFTGRDAISVDQQISSNNINLHEDE